MIPAFVLLNGGPYHAHGFVRGPKDPSLVDCSHLVVSLHGGSAGDRGATKIRGGLRLDPEDRRSPAVYAADPDLSLIHGYMTVGGRLHRADVYTYDGEITRRVCGEWMWKAKPSG